MEHSILCLKGYHPIKTFYYDAEMISKYLYFYLRIIQTHHNLYPVNYRIDYYYSCIMITDEQKHYDVRVTIISITSCPFIKL